MGQTKVSEPKERSAWPTAMLVVASVAAVSVALGLTVVGPLLQRKIEAPPPALALNNPALPEPAERASAEAEVQIKERIIPRPKPRPPAELIIPLGAPDDGAAFTDGPGGTSREASRESSRPSIRATIGDQDQAADAGRQRDSVKGEVTEAEDGAPPSGEGARARRRRLSPLEALPTIGSSLPRTPAAERGPAADSNTPGGAEAGKNEPAGEGDTRREGRSYRVQVGRFEDENDARRLRDELAGSGLSPQVVRTERDGMTLYRVQVGTYRLKENADRQVEQLKEQKFEPYIADDES